MPFLKTSIYIFVLALYLVLVQISLDSIQRVALSYA